MGEAPPPLQHSPVLRGSENNEGKWVWEHRPRKGIACDAVEQWVQIAKWRIDTEVDEIVSKAPLGKAA